MLTLGQEWLVDATGCLPATLQNMAVLQSLFGQLIAELGLQPVGEGCWHQFPETGGITGLVLLAESHLACHTWPEWGAISLNLYCCRAASAHDWPWQERLQTLLGATRVTMQVVTRGMAEADTK